MQTILTMEGAVAAEVIRAGGIVAFPTETVYGLGANAFDESAVEKIFKAKRRPPDNPLIAHVVEFEQIDELAAEKNENARRLIAAFFPGPLTVVLKKTERVPVIATAGLDTIGIRMPRFDVAREFLHACGVPIVAPSANLSGRPSPTTWQAVVEDLDGRIDCVLQGDPSQIGLESTVVDCTGSEPVPLRRGSVSIEELRLVVPEIRGAAASETAEARSPGMRHPHYSPTAKVQIVDFDPPGTASISGAYIGLTKPSGSFDLMQVCQSVEQYARALFEFFRECDRRGIVTIFCERVDEEGIGAALMDRIRRAAEG